MLSSKCILFNRFCSSKCRKKPISEIIKIFNYENKKLFGATIKSQSKKKSGTEKEANKNEFKNSHNQVNLNESGNINYRKSASCSEFYWLFEKNYVKNSVKLKQPGTQIEKSGNLKQCKLLKCTKIKELDQTRNQIIPFTNVKEILNFPLILDSNYVGTKIAQNLSFEGRIPSVGKILQSTLSETSRNALIKWKISKIAELGTEGFLSLQKDHLRKGKELHSAIENFLLYKHTPDLSLDMKHLWHSIEPALKFMEPIDVKFTETRINHPYLKYHGIVDCVSAIGDDMVIIEWKKSDRIKNVITATFDAPLQLCAYLGAINADPQFSGLNINKGFVVVAYTNGEMAKIFKLDNKQLHRYWHSWLKRLEEFWVRTRDNSLSEAL